jgi:hypothetical protein
MYLIGRHVVVSSVISNCKSYRHLTARVLELDRWDQAIVVKSQGHVDGVRPVIPHLRVRSAQENRQWGTNGSFVVSSLFKCVGQP